MLLLWFIHEVKSMEHLEKRRFMRLQQLIAAKRGRYLQLKLKVVNQLLWMRLLAVLKRKVSLRLLLEHWSEILLLGLSLKLSLWLLEFVLGCWTLLEHTGLLGLLRFERKLLLRWLVLRLLHERGSELGLLLLWLSKGRLVLSAVILLLCWRVKCIHLTRGFAWTVECGSGCKWQSCLLWLVYLQELVSCLLLLSLEEVHRPGIQRCCWSEWRMCNSGWHVTCRRKRRFELRLHCNFRLD